MSARGSVPARLAALLAVAGAALAIALAQPLGAPWWFYADADATYDASSLTLEARRQTTYLDHPGLQLQELLALTAEGRRLASGDAPPAAYADAHLRALGLDAPWWRGYAVAFYVLGAITAFLATARLLGSAWWGAAGGLLWIAAPGLAPMAIQYRPDVVLTTLTLAIGAVIVEAARRRSRGGYLVAALLIGFATMVKSSALALAAPLVVALLALPAEPARTTLRERLAGRRLPAALVASGAVLALAAGCWWFNRGRLPPPTTREEQRLVAGFVVVVAAYAAAAAAAGRLAPSPAVRRLFDPLVAAAAAAFAAGVALPIVLFPADGLAGMLNAERTWTGGGVNTGLPLFVFPHEEFLHWPLQQLVVLFCLAAAAAGVALRAREPMPPLLLVAALVLAVPALARQGTVHYFAPAFVLCVPAALWLLRLGGRRVALVATVALLSYTLVPQIRHVRDAAHLAAAQERRAAAIEAIGARLLGPGEAALVDTSEQTASSRYNALVENYVEGVPRFRRDLFYENSWTSADWLRRRRLKLRYYVSGAALELHGPAQLALAIGTYRVRPLPRYARPDLGLGVLELLSGPGVDEPYHDVNASGG